MPRRLDRSFELWEEALRLIPAGTQTFSKAPSQYAFGSAPIFLERGEGAHVFDVDGNEYIDYSMALGPVILGYAYPSTVEAVRRQVGQGTILSLMHPLEVEVAKLLVEVIPCAQMVRFGKNGSDATAGAVRAARAYTGREIIATCGYHGWQDWYISSTARSAGTPIAIRGLAIPFEYNRLDALRRILDQHPGQVAAVIMEPVGVTPPAEGFLQGVQRLCWENGALLIFDEVVTGFRLALGGAQELFDVTPDLACLGKAMGNGMPISAIVGRREVMQVFEEAFFSFTFGGETASLAAAKDTIQVISREPVIQRLWEQGAKLKDGYNELAERHRLQEVTQCAGYPPRTALFFKDSRGEESLELTTLFHQEAISNGILLCGGHNLCYSHSDADIDRTLEVYDAALAVLRKAIDDGDIRRYLRGPVNEPIFRRR